MPHSVQSRSIVQIHLTFLTARRRGGREPRPPSASSWCSTHTRPCHRDIEMSPCRIFFQILDLILKLSGCLQAPLAVQYLFQERRAGWKLSLKTINLSTWPCNFESLIFSDEWPYYLSPTSALTRSYTVYYGQFVTWHSTSLI